MARFSRRLDWASPANALAVCVEERRAAGAPLVDLTVSNPTRVGLSYPEAAITAALADPRALGYEPTPRGLPSTRGAIAAYYRDRASPALVDPEQLVVAASTSEAYAWIFKLLCDPGDAVLVPEPSYPLFDFLAALEAVRVVPYPLRHDGRWYVDLAALQQEVASLGSAAKAIVTVNPNNPTGHFLKRDERAALVALARERGLALVSDEVFADYAFAPDVDREDTLVDERDALCFSLSGLSKVVGLPQLKLGWIHVGGPEPERTEAQARLELVADTYLSVAATVQHAAPALLALQRSIGGAITARVRENHRALAAAVRGTASELLHVEGGWYGVVRVPATRSDERWAVELVEREGVLVQPGYFYDFPGDGREAYLVLSLLPEPARFADGVARLIAHVERA